MDRIRWLFIANLKSINGSLYEAAHIDGASPVQAFRRITLPLVVFYLIMQRNIIEGVVAGLVKG